MNEIERLEFQLRRSFEGESWHGPSLLEALANVTPEFASARPIANAHTIWEIVLHLIATYNLVLRRMHGNASPLTPEEDWPRIPSATSSSWHDTIEQLRQANEQLCKKVVGFNPEKLDQSFPGGQVRKHVESRPHVIRDADVLHHFVVFEQVHVRQGVFLRVDFTRFQRFVDAAAVDSDGDRTQGLECVFKQWSGRDAHAQSDEVVGARDRTSGSPNLPHAIVEGAAGKAVDALRGHFLAQ